jgi:amylosucrase
LIGCAPINYLRNHDDIGWAMTDEDLLAVGETPHLHRRFLNDFYSGRFPGSFARGELFQVNPASGDARVTGSTASLAGLEVALEAGDDEAIDQAVGRILLLHGLILGTGGIPVIHMGDELGLLNDHDYRDDPHHAEDSRWLNRPRMDWQRARLRHDLRSVEGRLFEGLSHLIRTRKATSLLHGFGLLHPLWTGNDHVLGYGRKRPEGTVLIFANFDDAPQAIDARMPAYGGLDGRLVNLLDGGAPPRFDAGALWLRPLEQIWLVVAEAP